MKDFVYYNPIKIVFGKGSFRKIPELIPAGSRILLIYGMGSVKKSGLLDEILNLLSGYDVVLFGGITPNPELNKCIEASELIREKNRNFILAVGGGSVIDAAKFISILPFFNNYDEAWEFMRGNVPPPKENVPLGVVPTTAGTGSESNSGFVITNSRTKEKLVGVTEVTFPKFSILNPEVLKSLPEEQLVAGIFDCFVHIVEQYITYEHDGIVQDKYAEALLKGLFEVIYRWKGIDFSYDYSLASNFMWLSSNALNNLLSRGVPSDWSTHTISHVITTLYGIKHAHALALVLFNLWRYKFNDKMYKLAQYGKNVLNIDGKSDKDIALKAIEYTENLFRSLGIKTKFEEYGINSEKASHEVAMYFKDIKIGLGEKNDIFYEDVKNILGGI